MRKVLAVIVACVAGGYTGFCIGFIVLSIPGASGVRGVIFFDFPRHRMKDGRSALVPPSRFNSHQCARRLFL